MRDFKIEQPPFYYTLVLRKFEKATLTSNCKSAQRDVKMGLIGSWRVTHICMQFFQYDRMPYNMITVMFVPDSFRDPSFEPYTSCDDSDTDWELEPFKYKQQVK